MSIGLDLRMNYDKAEQASAEREESTMYKRNVISGVVLASAITLLLGACGSGQSGAPRAGNAGARSSKQVAIRASTLSETGVYADQISLLAKYVEEMAPGRFAFTLLPGEVSVPAADHLDALSKGTLQINFDWEGMYSDKVPAFDVVTGFPGTTRDMADVRELGKRYADLRAKIYAKQNVVLMSITGHPAGTLVATRPLRHIGDLKGRKIGCDSSTAPVFSAFGATTVTLDSGDMYTSLSSGLVDAVEYSSITGAYELGLHEVGKYFIDMRAYPMVPYVYMANKTFWDSLSTADQAILTHASEAVSAALRWDNDYKLLKASADLKQKGVTIISWSDEDVAQWMAKTRELRPKYPQDPDWVEAWRIMDDYRAQMGY